MNKRYTKFQHLYFVYIDKDVSLHTTKSLLQLLAGAEVNALTNQKQTSLHMAASKDHHIICTVLIENGVDFDAIDDNHDNGVYEGYWITVV